jgi:hypothetical protein
MLASLLNTNMGFFFTHKRFGDRIYIDPKPQQPSQII